ncbi:tRNA-(ms[2]io[6]A)-hydroxylase [Candidatus Marimicrobium litorale]|uniref:tRNA-(Ms[2]io[6]A)-hydroxylase n=1 Tax=Candidatus Marimicrobium litorale TaxID=2518991 RepID=A0ABT3T463_9GAMM|nr:tRNA-(ms[2]io[6]A)-hydroxylase [Candidatus Marimicrobium litorale]MCX2976307.1 tRNA-(ms[2]io[6]A)-hydroxylase [Candidatus Marimicrobium litorale]
MTIAADLDGIREFLLCATPPAWVEWALQNPSTLLVDHANCEKKAASTALNLMYRYVEHGSLLQKLSRLAREELRHFEQVIAIMQARGVEYEQISASRYAGRLRGAVRSAEPQRLVDTLLVGAVIEARSCERFEALAPALDGELCAFYRSLLKSESRHYMDYLKLARELGAAEDVEKRVRELLELERVLVETPDTEFRFHSGIPPQSVRA